MKMILNPRRLAGLAAAALVATGSVGCAGEDIPDGDAPTVAAQKVTDTTTPAGGESDAEQTSNAPATGLEGDYAFGTDRDDVITVIEQAYEKDNASARWEGDLFIVAMDGDGEEDMAGFSDCRVLTQFLNEDDQVRIEYPNGTVECDEVLAEDD